MRYKILIPVLIIIAFTYSHVHFLYHQNLHQAHQLTETQQEGVLFSEGAFYYSFYKDFISADSFSSAIKNYFSSSTYEAPNNINPHRRFNISFELFTGAIYRLGHALGIKVSPIKLYNYIAYTINGLSLFLVLFIVIYMTQNIWAGALPLALYLTNFESLTRMTTNTPLRENAGITLFLFHVLCTLLLIKAPSLSDKISKKMDFIKNLRFIDISFVVSLVVQISFWQFTQFALIVNIIALLGLFVFSQVSLNKLLDYFLLITASWLITCVYLLGSALVVGALFNFISVFFIVTLLLIGYKKSSFQLNTWLRRLLCVLGVFTASILSHTAFGNLFNLTSDNHVFKFISQRLKQNNDFHALLYMCDDAFNSIGSWQLGQMFSNGFLYLLLLSMGYFLIKHLLSFLKGESKANSYYFTCLITIGFAIIAYMSQRFLIIGLPVAIIFIGFSVFHIAQFLSQKFNNKMVVPIISVLLSVAILALSKNTYNDLWERQRPLPGNTLAELTQFISENTQKNDIIVASMPLSSSVRLLTGRPIHLHPQYENQELRNRVKQSYKIYGNFSEDSLHTYFSKFKIKYVISEGTYCYYKSSTGCVMQQLINEGSYQTDQQFCDRQFKNSSYFETVFDNRRFKVLKVL